jgi:hypothetical protein
MQRLALSDREWNLLAAFLLCLAEAAHGYQRRGRDARGGQKLVAAQSTLADAGGRQEPAGGQGDKYDLVDGARDAGASDELWPARA